MPLRDPIDEVVMNGTVFARACALIGLLCCATFARAQTIPKDQVVFLTAEWKGERFSDGRPKAPDAIVDTLNTSIREALKVPAFAAILQRDGYVPDNRSAAETAAFFRAEV